MRTLITGGTGYIARGLATRLIAAGHAVRATFRGATPPAAAAQAGVEWCPVSDIGPDTDWSAALRDIDVVFHLAGVAHRITSSQAAIEDEYGRVNARGTEQLARSLAARGGAARIVMLSSIGAVCTTSVAVVDATTEPHPDSAYGRSKLDAERRLEESCRGTSVEWCVLRAPLVYGPNAPGNLRRLIGLVERGLPLPLGRATARRSLIYVGNLVDALIACAQQAAAAGQILLVADQETVSVAELIRMMAAARGRGARLWSLPPSWLRGSAHLVDRVRGVTTDRNDRLAKSFELLFGGLVLDTSRIRTLLAWRAPYSLREGLDATMSAPVGTS